MTITETVITLLEREPLTVEEVAVMADLPLDGAYFILEALVAQGRVFLAPGDITKAKRWTAKQTGAEA